LRRDYDETVIAVVARHIVRRLHIPISLISCRRFSETVWPRYTVDESDRRSRDRKNRRAS